MLTNNSEYDSCFSRSYWRFFFVQRKTINKDNKVLTDSQIVNFLLACGICTKLD